MKHLLGLKRFINKGILVIDVMSYYLHLKDHCVSLLLNNRQIKISGKWMQVLGAYEETESTLHVLLSCHSGLREIPLHKNDEKMMKAV